MDARTSPCGLEDATPGSRACVRVLVLSRRVGQAGLSGALWSASPFLLAVLSSCFAWSPPGMGCPFLLVCLPSFRCFFFAPVVPCFRWFPAPVVLGLAAVCLLAPPPPPFFFGLLALVGLCSSAAPLFRSPTHPLFFCFCFSLLGSLFVSPCPPFPLPRPLALSFVFLAPPLPFVLFSAFPALVGVCFLSPSLLTAPPLFFFCVPVLVSPRRPFPLSRPPHLSFCLPLPPCFPPPRVLFFFVSSPPLPFFFLFSAFPALVCICFLSPSLSALLPLFLVFVLPPGVCFRSPLLSSTLPPSPIPPFFLFCPSPLPSPPPCPCSPPLPLVFYCSRRFLLWLVFFFSHRLPFPPPPLFFSFLVFVSSCFFCVAVLPSSVLRVLLWCPASLRCVLPWPFVCAVGCCCVLCHVSGCFVPLLCSRCGPLSCCGLCCRVLCCVPGCCVAPCCCALLRPALCCCALCCVVSLFSVLPRVVSCPQALSVALRSCVVLSPRAVCSVLCVFWRGLLLRAVVCRCVFCCVRPGVSCCAFPVPSTLCGAGLRCAAAVASCCLLGLCYLWRLVLPCVVVCRAFSCGAVLYCCALCRVVLWPAVLCCGLQRGWLAALLCGAGFCAALLSLGALLPCAVLPGPVLLCGAVVSCPAALFVFLCLLVRFLLFKKPPHFVKKNIFFRF